MKNGYRKFLLAALFLSVICFRSLAQPVAAFTINYPVPVCVPASFSFNNTSSGTQPLSYHWQFGDNTEADTAISPAHTFDTCGNFLVTLIVTDAIGLMDTISKPVNVFCALQTGFHFTQSISCDTAFAAFFDETAGSPTGMHWTFGDPASGTADSSSQKNPTHHYGMPGEYVVSLTVTSQAGCVSSISHSLFVAASPQAAFTPSDSSICAGDTVFFTDASSPLDSITLWIYDFGDAGSSDNQDSSQNSFHRFVNAGDYTVTLTVHTINGCEKSFSKLIRVNGLPPASAGNDQTICSGDTVQLHAGGGISYAWNASPFLSDSASADPLAYPAATTTFVVQVSDTNGCRSSDSVIIHVSTVEVDAGNDTAVCFGTSAILHASGGISYRWSPAETLSDSTASDPVAWSDETTAYYLTATDSAGCTGVDSVTVHVHPPIVISFVALDTSYCSNHEPVNLTALPEGGLFSGDGVTGNQFFPAILSADSSYHIIYSYMDSIGCSAIDTASVFIHALTPVIISVATDTVCKSGNPVALELSPEGGVLYGNGISGNAFDPDAVDTAGNYFVIYTVTDSDACTNSDTASITVLPLPIIAVTDDTTICNGDSVWLSATGGISYLWSPADGLSSDTVSTPQASPPVSILYTVTVTDLNGCFATDSVLVTVFSSEAIDAGPDTSLCIGQSVMMQASGGSSYLWSPSIGLSDTTIANPIASPWVTTTYTVTISRGTCTGIDTVTILVQPIPVVDAGSDTFVCKGNSVQLQASGASAFTWQPDSSLNDAGIPSPVATPSSSTKYFVTGIDSNGCSAADSIFVEVKPLPVVVASDDSAICSGVTLLLYAEGAVAYHWNPESFVSDPDSSVTAAFPATTTWFEVAGIDSFGCAASDSVLITVHYSGNFISQNDTFTCAGTPVMLSASGADSYLWNPGIYLDDSTSATPVTTVADTTQFIVTGISAGCSGKDTITVIALPLPQITASNDTDVCLGSSVQLHVSGGESYAWSPGASLDDSLSANPMASPDSNTLFHVTGTDMNGCTADDSVLVHVHSAPVITITADTSLCLGESVLIIASGASAYSWQPVTALSAPQNDSTFAFPTQTTPYTVYGTDEFNCSNSATVTLYVHSLPNADAGPNQMACAGVPLQLAASGGIFYNWEPATGLSDPDISNPFATVSSDITYTVTVTDAYNCSNKDSVSLAIAPPLNASVSGDTTICAGTSAQLFAAGGSSYLWQPTTGLDNPASASPLASPGITTQYTVFISDNMCDTDTFTTVVHVHPLPAVDAGADANVLSGAPYQIYASAADGTYQWAPENGLSCNSCLNPAATIFETTTYTLTVTTPPGCSSSDEITLTVICSESAVYVPNAFTPNDNGHNDVLYVRILGDVDLHYFHVYDRWGQLIFETNNQNEGWDGTYNNKPMMPGAYLYEWEAVCSGGEVFKKQGNVTLLR
jgi:gliding motility-associated-like protein